ncbi:MAG TPA: hypothetical protein VIY48_13920 [Candidatus Paceibacterota bacterium]
MRTLNYIFLYILLTAHAVAATEMPQANDGKYARIFTYCRYANSYLVTPPEWGEQRPQQQYADNDFSAIPTAMWKMWKTKGNVFSPEAIKKMGLSIVELEAPKHGKTLSLDRPDEQLENHTLDGKTVLLPLGSRSFDYTFMPELGYLGKDRVVYEVKAYGKRYKVIVNFVVVPVVGDDEPPCTN